jgi:outer membrane immunogenic protein
MRRHMKKILLAGITAAALCGEPAVAADMPVKAPIYKADPMFSWTGFYVGGHVGGGWSSDWKSEIQWLPSQAAAGDANLPMKASGSSFLGGGQVGFNWQFDPKWVFGVEADLSGTNIKGTGHSPVLGFPGFAVIPGYTAAMSRDLDWLGSVRGRVGYAWDRSLLYFTGGFAYGHVKYSGGVTGPVSYLTSFNKTLPGWVVGGGIESSLPSAVGKWSVKLEYLYYALNSASSIANPVPPNPPFQNVDAYGETRAQVVRLGLNYRY